MKDLDLKDKTDLYENIIENNWDAIVFADMNGTVQFVNSAANELYGYEDNELIGQNVDVFNSHLTLNTDIIVEELMAKGHWYGELVQRRKDNSTFDALLHVQVIKNGKGEPIGLASNSKNISQDKETAKKLKQIINEKELLIREIHHRVKNNLSIVQGMLRLQKNSTKKIELDEFIIDFQTRLSVLAEAHNNLSQSAPIQEINLSSYIKKIVDDVDTLFAGKFVEIEKEMQNVSVSMDIAIPVGIIVNEIVTNAYKHAFNEVGGQLKINLNKNGNGVELNIQDNGPSFLFSPEMTENSMGLSLVDGLVSQLDGDYSIRTNGGMDFRINFNVD